MSDSFTRASARLAGLAARALGWRPAEFWSATPAELALSLGGGEESTDPPSREAIAAMIERDRHHG